MRKDKGPFVHVSWNTKKLSIRKNHFYRHISTTKHEIFKAKALREVLARASDCFKNNYGIEQG